MSGKTGLIYTIQPYRSLSNEPIRSFGEGFLCFCAQNWRTRCVRVKWRPFFYNQDTVRRNSVDCHQITHHLITDGSTVFGGTSKYCSCLLSGFAAIRNGGFRLDCGWFFTPILRQHRESSVSRNRKSEDFL